MFTISLTFKICVSWIVGAIFCSNISEAIMKGMQELMKETDICVELQVIESAEMLGFRGQSGFTLFALDIKGEQ